MQKEYREGKSLIAHTGKTGVQTMLHSTDFPVLARFAFVPMEYYCEAPSEVPGFLQILQTSHTSLDYYWL